MEPREEHPHRYVTTDYYVPEGKEPSTTRHSDGKITFHCSTWKYGWRFTIQLNSKNDAHVKSVRELAEAFGLRLQPPEPDAAEVETVPIEWAPESALLRRAREIDALAGESKQSSTYRNALELLVWAVTLQSDVEATQEEYDLVNRQMEATAGDDNCHQEREDLGYADSHH